jgi:hypothetical protein
VPGDGSTEDDTFDVCVAALQLPRGLRVRDPDDVLLVDRSLVEVLGGVVRGGSDQLDAAGLGLAVRVGARQWS